MNRSNGEGSIYRRKDGRFEAALFVPVVDGTRKRIRLYDTSRSGIEAKLAAARQRASHGFLAPVGRQRLADYLDHWLTIAERTKRPTTYLDYESTVRNYLRPGLGHKELTRLSVADVQRYLDSELTAGRSTRTIQKQRTVLSAALTRAQREELVVRNVARLVEVPQWHRKEITPWTVEQLATFLDAARADPLYPAFALLALYGLRIGEVLGLTWDNIDQERGEVHVRQQLQRYQGEFHLAPLKTHAGRRDLPLLNHAHAVLLGHRHAQSGPWRDLIFTTRFDNPIEPGNLRRTFVRLSKAAGLPIIKVHHLRHTTATLLKNLGAPARDVQLILGHASITTTQQLYQHADLDGHWAALNDLQRALQVGDSASRCRQELPSSALNGRLQLSSFSGRGDRTRTCDTWFWRLVANTEQPPLSEVLTTVEAGAKQALLGAVAVNGCRQPGFDAKAVERCSHLHALATQCRRVTTSHPISIPAA